MSIVMVLTSLVLAHHGHSLTAIAFSHMFHSAGMFAFTIPLGRLADRLGRETVMYPGVAVTLIGAILVTFTGDYWSVTLGTFLVGPGLGGGQCRLDRADRRSRRDHAPRPRHRRQRQRSRAAMTVLTAVVTGPLVECTSLPAAGVAAALFAAVPLLLLLQAQLAGLRRAA